MQRLQVQQDKQMHDQEVEAAIHAHLGDTEQVSTALRALLSRVSPLFLAVGMRLICSSP